MFFTDEHDAGQMHDWIWYRRIIADQETWAECRRILVEVEAERVVFTEQLREAA